MTIANDLDLQDFAEAERITPSRKHFFYWFAYLFTRVDLALILIITLLIAGGLATESFENQGFTWAVVGRTFLFLVLAGAFWYGRVRQFSRDRFGAAQRRLSGYRYRAYDSIEVDQCGIQMKSLVTQDVPILWSEVAGFHEGPHIFLVITKDSHEEILIPKAKMTDSEQTEARSLLEQKAGVW